MPPSLRSMEWRTGIGNTGWRLDVKGEKRSGTGEAEPFTWRPPVLAYPGKPVRCAKRGQREEGHKVVKIKKSKD
ncbi:hypothetical protein ABE23_17945 [Bacillus thuringiensis]|nr:hypothetical protein [Bacillus thuringiensis]OTW37598.1 hypothetical protein BK698_31500 [Bacillus thuringiensis serovar thuringiensis]